MTERRHVGMRSVEVLGRGGGLHWESLDLDLSVPALVSSVFAGPECMAELGRIGGTRSSAARPRQRAEMDGKVVVLRLLWQCIRVPALPQNWRSARGFKTNFAQVDTPHCRSALPTILRSGWN